MNKIFLLLLLVFQLGTQAQQQVPRWRLADLQRVVQASKGPVVLNFWATFCKPCLEEMPLFTQQIKNGAADSVQVYLVSLDLPEMYGDRLLKVARRFSIPERNIVYLDETNADIFCPVVDKRWTGGIPATLFLNNSTGYRFFTESEISKTTLSAQWRAITGK